MNNAKIHLATFFTSKLTTIEYFQEGNDYFLKVGFTIFPVSDNCRPGFIEDVKEEISQRFKIPLKGIELID